MTVSVFIDGGAGTTGIEIAQRLAMRDGISLIVLDDSQRKDVALRRNALCSADFAILCLPDDAAREAVSLAAGSDVRIIDASSAHRTAPSWTFGFPEMVMGQREAIAKASRVSNPGCYSTAFIALIAPLVARGLLPADGHYSCNAVSGYSGGGKAMIERFEAEGSDIAWCGYALGLSHKHVPEMQAQCGLSHAPLFSPAVVPAYRGMAVEVPLMRARDARIAPVDDLRAALVAHYADSIGISVGGLAHNGELLLHKQSEPSDRMTLDLFTSADGQHIRLVAALDNLGKGAGGACVQNLNIMAGLPETSGLRL
ncbi:MAG: N-acetyl-gamma-glutamyl-phosphate reductase [Sphingopyxis sp.]